MNVLEISPLILEISYYITDLTDVISLKCVNKTTNLLIFIIFEDINSILNMLHTYMLSDDIKQLNFSINEIKNNIPTISIILNSEYRLSIVKYWRQCNHSFQRCDICICLLESYYKHFLGNKTFHRLEIIESLILHAIMTLYH